ncbi:hypothetical protein JAAARDRAFT_57638 [Jaapia argillacea MUCL 33604]|uniref:Uncharacterized protein n=1 Tax=Jaapia argillacea MUCL 33604 TaxID=933084 RepID=A0A067PV97_9AGAM|nr:hypothetical protein JAAARDRAFT_57638 [Jaapia argillacea MUCL 33604]
MSTDAPPVILEFDGPSGELDSLKRKFSFDTASSSSSSSIVSDLPGPGRTLGNVIDQLGRKLEGVLTTVIERSGTGRNAVAEGAFTEDTLPVILEFDNLMGEVDSLQQAFTFDAASSSTASDLPGPGRTLGKAIDQVGQKLEGVLSRVIERSGRGPNAVADDALMLLDRTWEERKRIQPRVPPKQSRGFLRSPLGLDQFVENIVLYNRRRLPLTSVELQNNTRLVQTCRKLVRYLKDNSSNNRYLAVSYITALVLTVPGIQPVFDNLGALDEIRMQSFLLTRNNPDRDYLLAPSRRALVVLSESQALTTIKAFDHSVLAYSRAPTSNTVCQRFFSDVFTYFMDPDTQMLAAFSIVDALSREVTWNFLDSAHHVPDQRILKLWVKNILEGDGLCSEVFGRLLLIVVCQCAYGNGNLDVVLVSATYFLQNRLRILSTARVDKWLRSLQSTFFNGHRNWETLPASKAVVDDLKEILHHYTSYSSVELPLLPVLRDCVSLSAEIWRTFCRHWYFQGHLGLLNPTSRIPLRVIPTSIRGRLCRRLVELVLHSECPADDLIRVARHDTDCRQEFDRMVTLSGNTVCKRELSTMFAKFPAFESVNLEQGEIQDWCTAFYRDASLISLMNETNSDNMGPLSPVHGIYDASFTKVPATLDVEVLLAHRTSLRWVAESDLPSQVGEYKPIFAGFNNHGKRCLIGSVTHRDPSSPWIAAFPVIEGCCAIPDKYITRSTDKVHILAVRVDTEDQEGKVYWYNRQRHRLTHAITMAKLEPPCWLAHNCCKVYRCREWWAQPSKMPGSPSDPIAI